MKKYVKIIILVIMMVMLVVGLTGCTEYEQYGAKQGTIVDKEYKPAYTTYTDAVTYTGKQRITIPMPNHHPERYQIKIQKEENEKIKECWVDVTKQEYEQYKIGDYYN